MMGQKVSLYGFDINTRDPIVQQTCKLLQASITNFLTNWYGLKVVPFGQKAAFVVLNEATPTTVSKVLRQSTINGKTPAILVLCSHSSRFERFTSQAESSANVGYVAKPVGPLKLARALTQCLQGAPSSITPGLLEPAPNESNDLSIVFEELSMSPHGGEVLDNSRMAADSDNARKAIESPTPNAHSEKHHEFPFPVEDRPPVSKPQSMPSDKESLKPITNRDILKGVSAVLSQMEITSTSTSSTTVTKEAKPALSAQPPLPALQSPRLLLVDDNKINLTLLRTYMRKRQYGVVDEAENGFEAVKKVEGREDGYDIIFMDISMPVLDGFGATRQIRAIEASRRKKALDISGDSNDPIVAKTPALVIALTGLASSRDQNEAFTSGIDLFLTKPVAFKEVGKMLDNWEANRERESRGSLGSFSSK
jgi:CheY-like chemotaxis protein